MKKLRIKDRKLLKSVKETRCVLCGYPSDPCHIKSVGSGGDDVPDNLLPMCRYHHSVQHQLGWVVFVGKNPKVADILEEKGWKVETLFGRARLVRK